jgi:hypothetical protein
MYGELDRAGKELIAAYFKVLFRNLIAETEQPPPNKKN